MFCSKCGATLAANAAFCQSCGSPVTRALVAAVPPAAVAVPGAVSPHSGAGAISYVLTAVYAGFWLRFAAYLIDRIILGFASLALFVPFFFLIGGAEFLEGLPRRLEGSDFSQWMPLITMFLMLAGVAILVQWLYFAYFESGEKQATWGKQILGIYVTDLEGRRISFGHASGRFLAKIISGLLPLGVGYIMAGFTERKQALHDMIAATLVLRR